MNLVIDLERESNPQGEKFVTLPVRKNKNKTTSSPPTPSPNAAYSEMIMSRG